MYKKHHFNSIYGIIVTREQFHFSTCLNVSKASSLDMSFWYSNNLLSAWVALFLLSNPSIVEVFDCTGWLISLFLDGGNKLFLLLWSPRESWGTLLLSEFCSGEFVLPESASKSPVLLVESDEWDNLLWLFSPMAESGCCSDSLKDLLFRRCEGGEDSGWIRLSGMLGSSLR